MTLDERLQLVDIAIAGHDPPGDLAVAREERLGCGGQSLGDEGEHLDHQAIDLGHGRQRRNHRAAGVHPSHGTDRRCAVLWIARRSTLWTAGG